MLPRSTLEDALPTVYRGQLGPAALDLLAPKSTDGGSPPVGISALKPQESPYKFPENKRKKMKKKVFVFPSLNMFY